MAPIADVRVGAHDQQKVGVVVVGVQHGAGRAVQHPFFDQPVLALLLGQRIEKAAGFHQRQKRDAIRRVQVVGLTANANQTTGTRGMLSNNSREPLGYFSNGLVPTDLFKPAARLAFERMAEPLGMVDVMVNAEAFITDIAVRDRAGSIGPDVLDMPVIDIDGEAAVVTAQHADGRLVLGIGFNRHLGNGWVNLHCTHASRLLVSSTIPSLSPPRAGDGTKGPSYIKPPPEASQPPIRSWYTCTALVPL